MVVCPSRCQQPVASQPASQPTNKQMNGPNQRNVRPAPARQPRLCRSSFHTLPTPPLFVYSSTHTHNRINKQLADHPVDILCPHFTHLPSALYSGRIVAWATGGNSLFEQAGWLEGRWADRKARRRGVKQMFLISSLSYKTRKKRKKRKEKKVRAHDRSFYNYHGYICII